MPAVQTKQAYQFKGLMISELSAESMIGFW